MFLLHNHTEIILHIFFAFWKTTSVVANAGTAGHLCELPPTQTHFLSLQRGDTK